MKHSFWFKFWGTRGSIATPGQSSRRYGGNTACIEVGCGEHRLILDSGTGMRLLGDELNKKKKLTLHLFLTHFHWDHIMGLPFFAPAFNKSTTLNIYAVERGNITLERLLSKLMEHPFFPVPITTFECKINFCPIEPSGTITLAKNLRIRTFPLNHPGGATAYRIDYGKKSIAYITDNEHFDTLDVALSEFISGADYIIYDSYYDDGEYYNSTDPKKGWGHSTLSAGTDLAKASQVGHLVMFHHNPMHDDACLDRLAKKAKKRFANTIVAKEGTTLNV